MKVAITYLFRKKKYWIVDTRLQKSVLVQECGSEISLLALPRKVSLVSYAPTGVTLWKSQQLERDLRQLSYLRKRHSRNQVAKIKTEEDRRSLSQHKQGMGFVCHSNASIASLTALGGPEIVFAAPFARGLWRAGRNAELRK